MNQVDQLYVDAMQGLARIAELERFAVLVAHRAAEAERRPVTEEIANQMWTDCLSKYKRPGPFELINEFCARGITKEQA